MLLVIFSLIAIGIKPVCCYAGGKGASSSMNELRQELDKMFAKLDRNVVPTGLLRDYAIEVHCSHPLCKQIRLSPLLLTTRKTILYHIIFQR